MIGKDLKEYPATHSMATSWFFADEDGNIADFEFEDNGPVPEKVYESDSSLESMMLHMFASKDENEFFHFPMNEKQAEYILSYLKPIESLDIYSAVVQIDTSKKEDFLAYFSDNEKKDDLVCFSEECGLYAVRYFEEGVFKNMVEQGFIKKTATWDLYFDDIYQENGEIERKFFNADMYPFYIYQQEYDSRELIKRTIIPKYPYKLSQFPEHIQAKVVRLPLKFSENEKIQIAEFFPFEKTMFMYDNTILGLTFNLLPTQSGNHYYFASNIFSEICDWDYDYGFYPLCSSLTPTILYISANTPDYEFKRFMHEQKEILQQNYAAVSTNIKSVEPSPLIKLKKQGIQIPDNVTKYVSDKSGFFEQVFDYVNPHVVIIFEDALPQLRKWEAETGEFSMGANTFRINGLEYPYFLWNNLESNMDKIRRLAELPYRGRKRCVLTEGEYSEWEKLNELCKQ